MTMTLEPTVTAMPVAEEMLERVRNAMPCSHWFETTTARFYCGRPQHADHDHTCTIAWFGTARRAEGGELPHKTADVVVTWTA